MSGPTIGMALAVVGLGSSVVLAIWASGRYVATQVRRYDVIAWCAVGWYWINLAVAVAMVGLAV